MRAVLFDLDGTLLDIDLESFLRRYFAALGNVVDEHFPGHDMLPAILSATGAMQREHAGLTNREAFNRAVAELTGVDLDDAWPVFDAFYRDRFPALGDGYGPRPGARRALETAASLGLEVVIATQPIFPRAAIEHRLSWAGLDDLGLENLTTYEIMHACKPHAAYFREAAALAGADPADCLMVGDDRSLDMPAAAVGMRTFYVGPERGVPADWTGDLDDLADALPALAGAE